MAKTISGYYLRSQPRVWLGSPPADPSLPGQQYFAPPPYATSTIPGFEEVVYSSTMPAAGLKVEARRNGNVRFDFAKWPEALRPADADDFDFDRDVDVVKQRMQVMNLHVLCLNTTLVDEQQAPLNVLRLTTDDIVHFTESGAGGPGLVTAPLGYISSFEAFRPWAISVAVLTESFRLLDELLERTDDSSRVYLDLLQVALDAARSHDYALALTNAWTVCEALIDHRWRDYIAARREVEVDGVRIVQVNSARRDRLLGGRDFTAMVKTELLTLVGEIPHDFYEPLMTTRTNRNNWLHGRQQPRREDTAAAVETAGRFLESTLGLRVALPLSFSISPPN